MELVRLVVYTNRSRLLIPIVKLSQCTAPNVFITVLNDVSSMGEMPNLNLLSFISVDMCSSIVFLRLSTRSTPTKYDCKWVIIQLKMYLSSTKLTISLTGGWGFSTDPGFPTLDFSGYDSSIILFNISYCILLSHDCQVPGSSVTFYTHTLLPLIKNPSWCILTYLG